MKQDEERSVLQTRIWARAARCNTWDNVSKNPEQQVQETMFFKVMDLVHLMGKEKDNYKSFFFFFSL